MKEITHTKKSEAKKLYWQKIDKEKRKKIAHDIAKIKNDRMNFSQRRAHAMLMVEAKRRKKNTALNKPPLSGGTA